MRVFVCVYHTTSKAPGAIFCLLLQDLAKNVKSIIQVCQWLSYKYTSRRQRMCLTRFNKPPQPRLAGCFSPKHRLLAHAYLTVWSKNGPMWDGRTAAACTEQIICHPWFLSTRHPEFLDLCKMLQHINKLNQVISLKFALCPVNISLQNASSCS